MAKSAKKQTAKIAPKTGSKGIPLNARTQFAAVRNFALSGVCAKPAKNFKSDDGTVLPFADWGQGKTDSMVGVFARMTEDGDGAKRTHAGNVTSFSWTPEELRSLADECERRNSEEIALVAIPNFSMGLSHFQGERMTVAGAEYLKLSGKAAEKAKKRKAANDARSLLLESAQNAAIAAGFELGGPEHLAMQKAMLAALPA